MEKGETTILTSFENTFCNTLFPIAMHILHLQKILL